MLQPSGHNFAERIGEHLCRQMQLRSQGKNTCSRLRRPDSCWIRKPSVPCQILAMSNSSFICDLQNSTKKACISTLLCMSVVGAPNSALAENVHWAMDVGHHSVCPETSQTNRRNIVQRASDFDTMRYLSVIGDVSGTPTPYERGLRLEYGLDTSGRIRKCDTAAQPNCVSSAVSISGVFSPPWEVSARSSEIAMRELDSVLHEIEPDTILLEEKAPYLKDKDSDGPFYRRYKLPNPIFGFDIFEVLITTSADKSDRDHLVSYRFQAGTVKYIWPITQPIGDLGSHKKFLVSLRDRLGWRVAGGECDLLECFQE